MAHMYQSDFHWVSTNEPHASRRQEILEKHPEIKRLFGPDPLLKWIVTAMVLVQIISLTVVQHLSWPVLLVAAYCFGGIINHSLSIILHEIAHCSTFGQNRPLANKLFGIFANLPIGIPIFASFKKYHFEHHRSLGVDAVDPDLPTALEARLFCTTRGKLFWLFFQLLFYSFRPLLVRPKPMTPMELTNIIIQAFFDAVVYQLFSLKGLVYLVFGSCITMGLHPTAGHFISEHYMFREGFETYSYYGPLNWVLFNVGYHNEHHDFPAVSGRRLPQVKRIASEFYDNLPHHNSWLKVLYQFVTDPEIGHYTRLKRKQQQPGI